LVEVLAGMIVLFILGYLIVGFAFWFHQLAKDDNLGPAPKRLTRAERRAQNLSWKDATKGAVKESRKAGHWF
jgi:hypothetical protein